MYRMELWGVLMKLLTAFICAHRLHNDPWQAILRLALDQLQFDCLAANSTTCSGEAEAARSGDLAPLLAEAHWEAYNNVLYSGAAGLGYTKTIPSKVCVVVLYVVSNVRYVHYLYNNFDVDVESSCQLGVQMYLR